MIKSLHDPVVEQQGIEKGVEKGKKEKAIEIAKNLLDILPIDEIAKRTELPIEVIKELKKETENK